MGGEGGFFKLLCFLNRKYFVYFIFTVKGRGGVQGGWGGRGGGHNKQQQTTDNKQPREYQIPRTPPAPRSDHPQQMHTSSSDNKAAQLLNGKRYSTKVRRHASSFYPNAYLEIPSRRIVSHDGVARRAGVGMTVSSGKQMAQHAQGQRRRQARGA